MSIVSLRSTFAANRRLAQQQRRLNRALSSAPTQASRQELLNLLQR